MDVKKSLTVLFSALLLFQCEKEGLRPRLTTKYNASAQQTQLIAEHYYAWDADGTKPAVRRPVKAPQVFKDDNGEDLFHAYNYVEGGFVIVAADQRSYPILAFSETGNPDWNSVNEVNGLSLWLDITKQQLTSLRNLDQEADPLMTIQWRKFSSFELKPGGTGERRNNILPPTCSISNCSDSFWQWGPLFTTAWGQRGAGNAASVPDGNCDCGKAPAGCGPVAMGQVLRYYAPNEAFAYGNMADSWNRYNCTPSTQELNVAVLLLSCGAEANAIYSFGGCNTMTVPDAIPGALADLGLGSGGSKQSITSSKLATELSSANPVIMYGYDNIFAWHIWTCDGMRKSIVRSCENNSCIAYELATLHLNWGWHGDYNGWYLYGNYSTPNGNFNNSLGMIADIRNAAM